MESTQSIYPTLRYTDASAAIEFLKEAFGFEEKEVHRDGDTVVHAELRFGGSLIMLGDNTEGEFAKIAPPPGSGANYLVVEDADAAHERAAAAGAEIVIPPADQDYGSRDFTARDSEGNLWSCGTYRPSVSP
jgi:uncharacterized glyoxalase superfamily protein PhnB